MSQHRVKRQSRQHRGVRLIRLPDGRGAKWAARWEDPVSGAEEQQTLDGSELGLTNDDARHRWCVEKLKTLVELRRAVSVGVVTAERVTVRAAVDDYLAQQSNAGTKENKRIVLDAFVGWCDAQRVKTLPDIKPPMLMRWRDHLLSPKRCDHAASTRNRWAIASGIFLRWALRRGLVPLLSSDSIRNATSRAPEPVEAIEFLRPPELRKVLQAALSYDKAGDAGWQVAPFVLLLLLSGCRFDEAASLTWDEIDETAIRLPASRTKTKRAREIAFRETPWLGKLLKRLRPENAAGLVFAALAHSTWDNVRKLLIAEHGAPSFTAHSLRRTAGTILTNAPGIYQGASAWHSAKRLGHSVEQAERDYAGHLTNLPSAAKTLEAAAGIEDLCAKIIAAAGGQAAPPHKAASG